jgi:DDE superfamily endonuclease
MSSLSLPKAAEPLLSRFSIAFTRPTFQRAMVLLVGFVLTMGRRTVTRTLWTVRSLYNGCGHFSDYHRVFSRARWSLWPLGKALAAAVLELVPAGQWVVASADDTAAQHRGKHVYGKGRHRDACRSTRTFKAWLWGHCWVVLAIHVKFPFASRPWALPVLVGLYRTRGTNEKEGRRHKTPIALARQLMSALLRWFPDRRFVLLGDGGYASHGLARFCHRHRRRLTLVSLLHPRAHLCEAPPARRKGQKGRRRVRGAKLPHPQDAVAAATSQGRRQRNTVRWYGGQRRRVEFVSQRAHWYKATEGLVPIRWVFVHDLDGTHEDRYFYCTDPSLSPSTIIGLYTGRWAIEVTFQEVRQHLGFATPRNRKDKSVLRTAPCLLGLFSVVCLLFHHHHSSSSTRSGGGKAVPCPAVYPWYAKTEVTFSDALAAVRRQFWEETIFSQALPHQDLKKLPLKLHETLLEHLSHAA